MSEIKSDSGAKCHRCRYYHVTWDPKAPRGCKAHGFKSSVSPAQLVQKHSGRPCLLFEEKLIQNQSASSAFSKK